MYKEIEFKLTSKHNKKEKKFKYSKTIKFK